MPFPKSLPRYHEYNGDVYLQLHDHHTMWRLDNKCDALTEYELEMLYCDFVNSAVEEFKFRTGVEVFLLGRSGRHVCVEDTPENSRKYHYLRRRAEKLENKVIESFNSFYVERI